MGDSVGIPGEPPHVDLRVAGVPNAEPDAGKSARNQRDAEDRDRERGEHRQRRHVGQGRAHSLAA